LKAISRQYLKTKCFSLDSTQRSSYAAASVIGSNSHAQRPGGGMIPRVLAVTVMQPRPKSTPSFLWPE
jgi:hypothetical protein